MKTAFTICSNNYLAQAKTLGDSLRKHNPEYLFIIFLCDKRSPLIDYTFFKSHEIIEVEDLGIEKFQSMVSRYNVTELNTAVKPFCFEYIFNKYPSSHTVLYIDPDILLFDSLGSLEDELAEYSILLTPHIYTPIDLDGKNPTEAVFANHGIYNLGFIGLKKDENSKKLLSWWKERLIVNCYEKVEEGLFVDQLPMNFAPLFFNNVKISNNQGLNMAPWNLHERMLFLKDGKYYVNKKWPLIFYHFSNYNPLTPDILSHNYNRYSFSNHRELKNLYNEYREKLFINKYVDFKDISCFYDKLGYHRVPERDIFRKNLQSTSNKLELAEKELKNFHTSRAFKLALLIQGFVKFAIPKNSKRRKITAYCRNFAKIIFRFSANVYGGLLTFRPYVYRFLKQKRLKNINLNSKKIVFIGHSYHAKTKSTEFLIDYLGQSYDVDVILNDSWLDGRNNLNLSFINENYLGVIFFQLLPPPNIIKKIKNDNIIYFPMYDQSGRLGYSFWHPYRDLKIANFSKALHKKLLKWGFDSMYVQYFPKLQEFCSGKPDEVFFWQRLTELNISTIAKLFARDNVKIHMHRAIDPDQQFVKPSEEDEKKYQITYSDWFETREEMQELIRQKGIYVAPREYEGIGLSFLEAMAMGKAVIAVDNPTMNEYIENGKTGYLFNLSNPREIDLSNIEQVQRNTHEFMREGRKRWESEKQKIIDFIKKS